MNIDYIEDKYKLNPDKWIVHKKIENNPSKKYTIIFTLFVLGLVLVSTIKNETRKLQKEVNDIQSSLRVIKITLHEAILDNQVITSPENIAKLASEYLEEDFTHYKKLQIKTLDEKDTIVFKNKKISDKLKIKISEKIEQKKVQLRKLQALYSEPEQVPKEIKILVNKKIEDKKNTLKTLYSKPKETIQSVKLKRWATIQFVKVILGIPVIPGR